MRSGCLNASRLAACLAVVLLLSGCKGGARSLFDPADPDMIDVEKGLKRKDYDDMLKAAQDPNVSFKTKGQEGPPIPDLAPILAAPQPPKLGQTKLVSVTVTDDVPLKDVLLELARLADVDIEIDANISGGIAFRAKDRPFNEVIERIADLAGLRYSMKDGVLRVERDTPYVEVYPLDFVNVERSSTSSVNISTNVLSGAGGGGGAGGLNTGSSASITASSASDFWKQFEDGVKQILSYKAPSNLSGGESGPSVPGRPPAKSGSSADEKTFYSINRQGSTLTVSATQRQQEMLKRFLKQVEANASAQVLIEAKIVEVTLNKQFQSGIDWKQLGNNRISFAQNVSGVSTDNTSNVSTIALNLSKRLDLNAAVSLVDVFGTSRTLSSPRLHAINNQQAVLTFAQNDVYFQVNVTQNTTTTAGSGITQSPLTVNSTIKTVPIGIILTLQPSINLDTDEITLDVRPTLSKVVGNVEDPAVAFLIAQAVAAAPSQASTFSSITSTVPVVEVREMDSILKLKSGQVMVIGGLMQDSALNNETGLPGASHIPILGDLFKTNDRENSTSELVIFIRATITDSHGNVPASDKALYKKFMNDPRPLDF